MAHRVTRSLFLIALATMLFTACASTTSAQSNPENSMTSNPKQSVSALLKSIETGDSKPVGIINPEKYIQHNLVVADGLAGFGALMQLLPKDSARVNTVRLFQDGEFVFSHTDYDFFGPKVGFDIFRFESGRIVEHWDNLQEKPANPNPSGHTMLDGPTEVIDLEKTAENKSLVRAFVEDVLVRGQFAKLPVYIDGENYTQHNPHIGDGLSGLSTAIQEMAKHGVTMKYQRIHMVLGEGNFVLTVSEGEFAGKHTSFYDLFRVSGGKIVEHWDTIETIPPREQWKNGNGKF